MLWDALGELLTVIKECGEFLETKIAITGRNIVRPDRIPAAIVFPAYITPDTELLGTIIIVAESFSELQEVSQKLYDAIKENSQLPSGDTITATNWHPVERYAWDDMSNPNCHKGESLMLGIGGFYQKGALQFKITATQ